MLNRFFQLVLSKLTSHTWRDPHAIILEDILQTVEKIYLQDKTALIVDTTKKLFSFYKYKGNVINFMEFFIARANGEIKKSQFLENIRKKLVYSMKVNYVSMILDN